MQTQWSGGYVVDTPYTFNYFSEMSPLRVRWSLLLAGREGLERPRHACELGFGNGISINVHAAANPSVAHWGTDFNPAQAAFAQTMAQAAGHGAHLFDQSFADFAARSDLPEFDFIGLHGIWSWVGPEAQRVVTDLIRQRLKPGGVVYLSYNSLPGWAPLMPVRELLAQHAGRMGREADGAIARSKEALEMLFQMVALRPAYVQQNPAVQGLLAALRQQDLRYVAHEYFSADWSPYYFGEVARALEGAKLAFAAPADYLDHINPIHLSPESNAFLGGVADPILRETMRDYFLNSQFRSDYWVKGQALLNPAERDLRIRASRFVLRVPRRRIEMKVRGALGEVLLREDAYKPLLDLLASGGGAPQRVGDLERTLGGAFGLPTLVPMLTTLAGMGCIGPAHESDEAIEAARPACDRMNRWSLQQASHSQPISWLASPVTGSGYALGRIYQMFLVARSEGAITPEQWAAAVWKVLQAQGQTVTRKGTPLVTPEENLRELTEGAREFAGEQLPLLQALGIV